jgi:hypothetical protein
MSTVHEQVQCFLLKGEDMERDRDREWREGKEEEEEHLQR